KSIVHAFCKYRNYALINFLQILNGSFSFEDLELLEIIGNLQHAKNAGNRHFRLHHYCGAINRDVAYPSLRAKTILVIISRIWPFEFKMRVAVECKRLRLA